MPQGRLAGSRGAGPSPRKPAGNMGLPAARVPPPPGGRRQWAAATASRPGLGWFSRTEFVRCTCSNHCGSTRSVTTPYASRSIGFGVRMNSVRPWPSIHV